LLYLPLRQNLLSLISCCVLDADPDLGAGFIVEGLCVVCAEWGADGLTTADGTTKLPPLLFRYNLRYCSSVALMLIFVFHVIVICLSSFTLGTCFFGG
jgi:hypothetical protein